MTLLVAALIIFTGVWAAFTLAVIAAIGVHMLIEHHVGHDPVDRLLAAEERSVQSFLYGGRRTIDVAPLEAPASSYNSRRVARHESSDDGRD